MSEGNWLWYRSPPVGIAEITSGKLDGSRTIVIKFDRDGFKHTEFLSQAAARQLADRIFERLMNIEKD